MRLVIILATLGYFALGIGLTSGEGTNNRRTTTAKTSVAPIVQIESVPTLPQNRPLAFRCTIANPGSEPLFLYSALFQDPWYAQALIDPEQNAIEVRFSRLETDPILPYYFPRAAFREIGANSQADFNVALRHSVRKLSSYDTINGKAIERRITPGRWTLKVMIGYGDDLSAVRRALALNPRGTQHPINEIVNWQRVAYSNSITVEITK
jgi:hypothetical protein